MNFSSLIGLEFFPSLTRAYFCTFCWCPYATCGHDNLTKCVLPLTYSTISTAWILVCLSSPSWSLLARKAFHWAKHIQNGHRITNHEFVQDWWYRLSWRGESAGAYRNSLQWCVHCWFLILVIIVCYISNIFWSIFFKFADPVWLNLHFSVLVLNSFALSGQEVCFVCASLMSSLQQFRVHENDIQSNPQTETLITTL